MRATGDGRAFAFRHPLVRRAVYDAAPPAWRLAAHERVAAALAARGAGPAVRADHVERYARQGDLEARRAARRPRRPPPRTPRPPPPRGCTRAALRLLPEGDAERRAALLGPLALAQGAAGGSRRRATRSTRCCGCCPPEPTPMRVRLIGAAATIEAMLGQVGEMRRRVLAALDDVPPEQSALLELTMAFSQYYSVDFAAMREWAARAAAHAGEDEQSVRAGGRGMGGLATLLLGEPEAGQAMIDGALERLGGARRRDAGRAARRSLPGRRGGAARDRSRDALVPVTRAMTLARATHQDRMVPMLAALRCMMLEDQLRLDDAMADADTATEAARLLGNDAQLHPALMMQAQILWLRGDRAEAARVARRSASRSRCGPSRAPRPSRRLQRRAAWVDEDPERCIREMAAAAGPMLERVDQSWGTWLLAHLVRAALALGRLDDAERWTRQIEERAELTRLPGRAARGPPARAPACCSRAASRPRRRRSRAPAADDADAAGARLDAVAARLTAGPRARGGGRARAGGRALQRVAADAGARRRGPVRRGGRARAAAARQPAAGEQPPRRRRGVRGRR